MNIEYLVATELEKTFSCFWYVIFEISLLILISTLDIKKKIPTLETQLNLSSTPLNK